MEIQADEKIMIRYLLGDMKEDEQVRVEEQFFGDDEFYAQITAIQEELIDDYLHGDLAARERELFERHFLSSPKRRERVEFATALAQALPEPQIQDKDFEVHKESLSWWQSALAFLRPQTTAFALAVSVAILAILSGVMWLVIENRRLGAQLELVRNEQAEISNQTNADKEESERRAKEQQEEKANLVSQVDNLKAELNKEKNKIEELERKASDESRSSNSVVSFALFPGLVIRSGNEPADEPEKLVIPPRTHSVKLQLELDKQEPYQSYRAELRTAGGNLVWSQSLLPPHQSGGGQAVVVTLPARTLSQGEYEVTLAGINPQGEREVIGYYYFIALKR